MRVCLKVFAFGRPLFCKTSIKMKNLTNYHSHCNFCDGNSPMELYVQAAIEAGFSAYGISSHAPLPYPNGWTLNDKDLPAYIAEFNRIKALYGSQIELYLALELDYINKDSRPVSPKFQDLPLDYRIGAVHLIVDDNGQIIDTDSGLENLRSAMGGDLRRTIETYYRSMMHLVEDGGIDFVAHPDKIAFGAEQLKSGISSERWWQSLRKDLFAFIKERDLIAEVNTKAFDKSGVFFPDIQWLKLIKEMDVNVVVNSDSHRPHLINSGRPEALAALKAVGITSVCEFHHGAWQSVGIADFY